MTLSERTFGVEIECFGKRDHHDIRRALKKAGLGVYGLAPNAYEHDTRRDWVVKGDCSIIPDEYSNWGVEVASPILVGKDGLKQVRTACRVLRKLGFKTNKSCGIHVHVGVKDLQASEIYTVIKRYQTNESLIDGFMNENRRGTEASYAQPVGEARWSILREYEAWKAEQRGETPARRRPRRCTCGCGQELGSYNQRYGPAENPFRNAQRLCDIADFADRYCKVNTQAYNTYGTLEFRHHHGSVSGTEITNWIKFLVNFVETSRDLTHARNERGETISLPKRQKDNGIFMGLKSSVKRHFESRKAA